MYYVYILQSLKDEKLYIGCTNDFKNRFKLHNQKRITSTASRTPFILIYYEVLVNKQDAFAREQWLKTGWGRNHIKKILSHYFVDKIHKSTRQNFANNS